MTRRRHTRGTFLAMALVAMAAPVDAQPSAPPDATDSIRCWWRTSAGAVATGEPFDASLTCAVYDDGSMRVVVDESRLGALAIQLGVFEVLGGTHPPDLRTGQHRFFQYHYTVRVIDRDVIGKDAVFPDINVPYRLQTGAAGGQTEGRERTYVIPGQSVRVLSLVPQSASDIRDTTGENFARVESLRFRARALGLAALGLGALAVIALIPALMSLAARGARVSAADDLSLPASRILAQVARELDDVDRASRGGWSADLAARAATALRLAASCALGRHISRRPAAGDAQSGRLIVATGLLRRRRTSASSAITSADVRKGIDRLPLTTPAAARDMLDGLERALTAFTASLYRPAFDSDGLNAALEQGRSATARLRRVHTWPRELWKAHMTNRSARGALP